MLEAIKTRLGYNAKRVENLLSLYGELAVRKDSSYASDILRSAVVLLHATLEDVIRGLLKWKKMRSNSKALSDITFYLDEKETKSITLAQLAAVDDDDFEDMTVRTLIKETIRRHYDRETFNNRRQLNHALESLGIVPKKYAAELNVIEPMTKRRHLIVHQGDRGEPADGKHGRLTDIDAKDVKAWLVATQGFLSGLIDSLEPKPAKPKPNPPKKSKN
jgi:hypothetical protein